MTIRKVSIAVAFSLVTAQAHPGHEPFSEGTKHFIASPNHFLPALIFAALLFAAAHFLLRKRELAFVRSIAIVILAFTIV